MVQSINIRVTLRQLNPCLTASIHFVLMILPFTENIFASFLPYFSDKPKEVQCILKFSDSEIHLGL